MVVINGGKKCRAVTGLLKAGITLVGILIIAITMPLLCWIVFDFDFKGNYAPCVLLVFSMIIFFRVFAFRLSIKLKVIEALPLHQQFADSYSKSYRKRRKRNTSHEETHNEEHSQRQEETSTPLYECRDEENHTARKAIEAPTETIQYRMPSLTTSTSNEAQSRSEKRLLWNEMVRVKVVRNLDNYTTQEKDDCWYSTEEYSRMYGGRINQTPGCVLFSDENDQEESCDKFQVILSGGLSTGRWITQRIGNKLSVATSTSPSLDCAFADLSNHSHTV